MKINNKLILTLIFGFLVNINAEYNFKFDISYGSAEFKLKKEPSFLDLSNKIIREKDLDYFYLCNKDKNKKACSDNFLKIDKDIVFSTKESYYFFIKNLKKIYIKGDFKYLFIGKKCFYCMMNEKIEVPNPFDKIYKIF